jgi:hypothetical protein
VVDLLNDNRNFNNIRRSAQQLPNNKDEWDVYKKQVQTQANKRNSIQQNSVGDKDSLGAPDMNEMQ